jgi:PAS domain S-box-containing protein
VNLVSNLHLDLPDMCRALECGQFVPYFQPVSIISTGQLHGFEVLARWDHPELGLISPATFIPIAERDGWLGEIMCQVLNKAFSVFSSYGQELRLAFNISPLQLKDTYLPGQLSLLANSAGFSLQWATVEITESAIAENVDLALQITGELKAMGCRLALDDFGTGYSSLYHLKSLPFDELKVDRKFVNSMTTERESRKIVAAVVGLGQSLGLSTVAEGIETQEQAEMLLRLGCHMGQGWFYGRPGPAESLPAVIEFHRTHPVSCASDRWKGLSLDCREGIPAQRLALLQAVYEGAPLGLGFLDRKLKYVNINQRLAEMHGVPIEEHYGKTIAEIIPGVYPLIEVHLKKALNGEGTTDLEIHEPACHLHDERTFLTSYQPAFDEAGEVVGVSCAVIDFTTRKGAEDKLRQFERLVEGLDEMVAVVDQKCRFVLANHAFKECFATGTERIEGRFGWEFVDGDLFEQVMVPKLAECFSGSTVLFSLDYDVPGKGRRRLNVSYFPIEVCGAVNTIACVIRDVTHMKQIELAETDSPSRAV